MYKLNADKLNQQEKNTLDELTGYYDDEQAMLEAITTKNNKLTKHIHKIANRRPSIYTYDRLQWAADNVRMVQDYEDEANGLHDGTIAGWAAACWYLAEQASINDDIAEIRKQIEEEDEQIQSCSAVVDNTA